MAKLPLISVVDDDESVRESLPDLLREFGYDVRAFASAEEFLKSDQLTGTTCLITDVQMPGMSGIDLQARLKESGNHLPVIVITAFPDEAVRKRAMQLGALSFLAKPLDDAALTDCLDRALQPH